MPLTLGRKPGQGVDVLIGGQTVRIVYLGHHHGEAKIRVDAPKEFVIHRADHCPLPSRREPLPPAQVRVDDLSAVRLVGLGLVNREDVLASRASTVCPACGCGKGAHQAVCGLCHRKLTPDQRQRLALASCGSIDYLGVWESTIDLLGFKAAHIPKRRTNGAAKAG